MPTNEPTTDLDSDPIIEDMRIFRRVVIVAVAAMLAFALAPAPAALAMMRVTYCVEYDTFYKGTVDGAAVFEPACTATETFTLPEASDGQPPSGGGKEHGTGGAGTGGGGGSHPEPPPPSETPPPTVCDTLKAQLEIAIAAVTAAKAAVAAALAETENVKESPDTDPAVGKEFHAWVGSRQMVDDMRIHYLVENGYDPRFTQDPMELPVAISNTDKEDKYQLLEDWKFDVTRPYGDLLLDALDREFESRVELNQAIAGLKLDDFLMRQHMALILIQQLGIMQAELDTITTEMLLNKC